MAWVTITTDDGEVVERMTVTFLRSNKAADYDLGKPVARSAFMQTVIENVQIAEQPKPEGDGP